MKRHLPLFAITVAIIVGSNVYYTSARPPKSIVMHHAAPLVRRYDDGVVCPGEAVLQKNMADQQQTQQQTQQQSYIHRYIRAPFRWLFRCG